MPYETRVAIAEENGTDESLRIHFKEELVSLASDLFDADDSEYTTIADLVVKVIHKLFEKQGLLFSHFLEALEDVQPPPVVSDCIDEALVETNVNGEKIEQYREWLENLMRRIFYDGTPNQRAYLSNLSKTYILLFTLKTEPKLIEYFSTMSSHFNLYLGSDILVKAISERYLTEENQVARNMLRMASQAGVKMYLSEFVLEEVYTHIRATYYEFKNHFEKMESYITSEVARNSEKILIRSYFYAKFEKKVKSWKSYLDQFISYNNIESPSGRAELKNYLLAEFGLTFVDNKDLESVTDSKKVSDLAQAMMTSDDKENEALAYNTALLVYGIYGLRRKNNETQRASEYGLKTWWMTNQSRVLRHTSELLKSEHAKYLMRPEFLLNFLAISPTCDSVRESFKNVFPSLFGIQLGHRLKEDVFHGVLEKVKEWHELEPGRITAKMSSLSDELKTDRTRRHDRNLNEFPELQSQ